MCTVSFITHSRGFYLAMNRDEALARPTALGPRISKRRDVSILCPGEPGGGTWIGLNDSGLCLALLNWNIEIPSIKGALSTRGDVIPALLPSRSFAGLFHLLRPLPLDRTPPFRLTAIGLFEKRVSEFRWDGCKLREKRHPWKPGHWFSSGHDEAGAAAARAAVCRSAREQPDAGSLSGLRRLHASHEPTRGPLSICMHRPDAATVSYTEIAATAEGASMLYVPFAPCKETAGSPTNSGKQYETKSLRFRRTGRALLRGRLSPRY